MRTRSGRRPRRSTRVRLAGLAAAIGLAVLTGTDDVDQADPVHASHPTVDTSTHEPAGTAPAPDTPQDAPQGPPQDAPPDAPQTVVLDAARPTRLTIPAIGVDAVGITDLGLRADRTIEVPPDAETVGWYRNSPTPGENGPALLAAHVDWQNRKGVFYDLRKLQPDDQVTVERADGSVASFTVRRVEQHPKDRFPTQAVYGHVERPELRLVTCGGQFDRAAGSYLDNIVVYAEMTGSRHRDEASGR
ncbi:class F sortase [Saccharothrix sp. NRRL B-16314]|uniref:class F sortase n=1 Tax=Saccharothrix sp. NRRL B-16314 TaxID=1463825 RepID=UPI0009E0739D|nr:class F sortase [Saccharothrix sp. NRRL B-16314]